MGDNKYTLYELDWGHNDNDNDVYNDYENTKWISFKFKVKSENKLIFLDTFNYPNSIIYEGEFYTDPEISGIDGLEGADEQVLKVQTYEEIQLEINNLEEYIDHS